MKARILQKVDDVYIPVWTFLCYPGIEMIFENIQIDIESGDQDSIENYALSINETWDAFCVFETETTQYQFPLALSDIDALDGTLYITIPITHPPGQYNKHIQLLCIFAERMPIFGSLILGKACFAGYVHDPIDASTLPIIRTTIKAGVNVPIFNGYANSAEKEAVIHVLADWLADVDVPLQEVIAAIDALEENATSQEIYEAYMLTKIFVLSKVPAVTLSNAVLSIQNEVLG